MARYLDEGVGGKITNRSAGANSFYRPTKKTQGKVVPVMKGAKPRKPVAPKKPIAASKPTLTPNQQGVNAQQQAMERRTPSPQIAVSYESDPVLARIRALGTQDVANARTEADSLRKKAIIDSGLTDVGSEIGVDQSTLQAAQANPFSTRAMIEKTQLERGRELDESLNQQNLFYGGHRANQLTELANSGAQNQATLNSDIRSLLGQISGGVTDAEVMAAQREQEALEEVAAQERQAALEQSYFDAMFPPDPYSTPDTLAQELGMARSADGPRVAMTPEEELLLALGGHGGGPGQWQYA